MWENDLQGLFGNDRTLYPEVKLDGGPYIMKSDVHKPIKETKRNKTLTF